MKKQIKLPGNTLLSLYANMIKIRMFEERVSELLLAGEIKCPTHLYIGQEAVAAGVCANLRKDDYTFGTYRSHGFYIAKGGDLNGLMAELLGKATGCSRGRGGSMHVVAPEIGILGTSAIVGGTVPLAVGCAMAMKLKNDKRVVVSFFGDGATDEGVFYESVSFASLKKLPIVFVCENNFYSTHLPLRFRQPADNIWQRVKAFTMPAAHVDGNDVVAVYLTSRNAVEHARAKEGPFFIECRTYRWRAHVGPWDDIDVGFRTRKEVDKWKKRCPIKKLERTLFEMQILNAEKNDNIRTELEDEIAHAYEFASQSVYPDGKELLEYVYRK